ncbi:MAG: hypothetical protein ABJH05_13310 [Fulvivirga sp.]
MACLLLLTTPVMGQTVNDNMANAEKLIVDQFVYSLTNGNTVEHSCVDETLTGKCIDYHNDQWYTFEIGDNPHVYINLSGQDCRDMRGVQLVVLSGELCKPETYKIYDCISTATQDDIYVALDLEPNQKYWLNIDGYLHDFCKFFIEVSYTPKGMSKKEYPLDSVKVRADQNIFDIRWSLPDSLSHAVMATQVLRKQVTDFKFDSISAVPVQYNAYGDMRYGYSFRDTLLFPGNYQYRLALVLQDGRQLFAGDYDFNTSSRYGSKQESLIILPLDYRRGTFLKINFKDVSSGKLIRDLDVKFDPRRHSQLVFYKNKFSQYKAIEIEVINKDDSHSKSHFYTIQ